MFASCYCKTLVKFCFLQFIFLNLAVPSHIVGFPNLNFISHSRVLWKLGKELTTRGHRYTQLLGDCAKETSLPDVNVTIFNTSVTSEHIEKLMISFGKQGEVSSLSGMWNLMSLLSMSRKMCETFCEDLFLNKKLMAELKGSVDLVLCDLSNLCCTVFSELLGVPHVSVITVAFMEPLVTSIIEMPEIILHMSVQFGKIADNAAENDQQMEHLSFANRLKNTLIYFFAQMILTGEFIPTRLWDDHAKGISKYSSAYEAFWKRYGIVLVSHDFAFTYPQPLYANVKMIGPVLPKPAKNLSAELEKFMSVHKKVVLVSFGTVLSQYNEELLNTLSAGLSKVPLQVLWKHSGVPPTFVGNNTKIVQWMPQNDILGHMSTAVFLTHGGLNSFQESVYHGVPVIVMPLFGDQHWAASVCTQKQLGVVLDKADLEPHKVSEAVMEVVKNNVYKQNVMIISKRLKHRKRTSAQEGADWIEYALENDGAYHLRSPAGNLAFYQRYMLDVFLFISLITFLLMFLIMKMLKCIFCRVPEQRKDKKKYS